MIRYVASEGEMLDQICWRQYGRNGLVPQVLDVNPGLEALGPRLPAGAVVMLPVIPAAAPAPLRRLWD